MMDKEEIYIAKVRKSYSSRRRTYAVLIVMFFILAVPHLYYSISLSLEIKQFTEHGEANENYPTMHGESSNGIKMDFYLGITIGTVLSGGFLVLGILISAIIQHYFNFKKDGLLIKYYDASKQ